MKILELAELRQTEQSFEDLIEYVIDTAGVELARSANNSMYLFVMAPSISDS